MRRPGLWVANGSPSDPAKMLSWRPGALTCFFDYLGANRIRPYKQQNPDVPIIVRFLHPHNWHVDPVTTSAQLASHVAGKWPDLQDIDPYVYFCNELNLHYENGDDNPGNQHLYETPDFYRRYAQWVKMTADRIKQSAPRMRLVCPPFAYGHHEDGAPDDNGNPKEGWAGYDSLVQTNVIQTHFNNIITFHAYWGDAGGSIKQRLYDPEESSWHAFRWRRVLKLFEKRYGIQAKVIIDEAGNFGASDPDFTDQVIYYARQCLADERVIALTFFLWQDPTSNPGNIRNSWVQRCMNLTSHVTRLAAMSDVVTQPGPSGQTIRVLLPDNTVRVMLLEEYLRGVVPAEMPSSWPLEALKVQAVAARSYAMVAISHPRHHPNADICTDVHCQAYNESRINPNTDLAVQATKGQAIMYQGKVASAYYSSNCGGVTVGNETAWGGPPLPYCRPVNCVNPGPKNGHAVGMCQWGAHDMAVLGNDYVGILKHYYTGVTLSSETAPGQGLVSGTLRDQNGNPLAARQITLSGPNVSRSVMTDAGGVYRFDSLPAGTYIVTVVGTNVSRYVYSDGATSVTLDLMLPVTPVPTQGVISGVVRDFNGVPQAGRQMTLTGVNLTRTVSTDNQGAYRFDGLAAGMYAVSVVGVQLTRNVWSNGYTPVTLDLALPPVAPPVIGQGVIAGVVRNQANVPQVGWPIKLTGPNITRTVTTDGAGSYRFDGLAAGTYLLMVESLGVFRYVWSNGKTPVTVDLKVA
jgi:Stage II sporulation protein/Carboxypeptidase regulatory-like domain